MAVKQNIVFQVREGSKKALKDIVDEWREKYQSEIKGLSDVNTSYENDGGLDRGVIILTFEDKDSISNLSNHEISMDFWEKGKPHFKGGLQIYESYE